MTPLESASKFNRGLLLARQFRSSSTTVGPVACKGRVTMLAYHYNIDLSHYKETGPEFLDTPYLQSGGTIHKPLFWKKNSGYSMIFPQDCSMYQPLIADKMPLANDANWYASWICFPRPPFVPPQEEPIVDVTTKGDEAMLKQEDMEEDKPASQQNGPLLRLHRESSFAPPRHTFVGPTDWFSSIDQQIYGVVDEMRHLRIEHDERLHRVEGQMGSVFQMQQQLYVEQYGSYFDWPSPEE